YTGEGIANLWNGAYLFEKDKVLYADSLNYNEKTEIGEGFCNVDLYDSTETIQFKSDYLWKGSENDTLILKYNARILDFSETDTIEIHADTIFHYTDSLNQKSI